jgi:hypothetical protein
MSSLVHTLGLSEKLAFHDVFSIDEPELLAFVPRPAHALLLVFPVSETYEKFRIQEDKDRPEYQGHGPEEEVVWYKQTIGNACGLIGLLHGVSNGAARSNIGTIPRHVLDALPTQLTTLRRPQLQPRQAPERCHSTETHRACRSSLRLGSTRERASSCCYWRRHQCSCCRGQRRSTLRLLCQIAGQQFVGAGWPTQGSAQSGFTVPGRGCT